MTAIFTCCTLLPRLSFSAIASADGHMFVPYNAMSNHEELEMQLKKLCSHISMMSDYTAKIKYSLLKGLWEDTLIDVVKRKKIDLVLIGQTERRNSKKKNASQP